MLIKARVAAGDRRPGRELLEFVEPLYLPHHHRFPHRGSFVALKHGRAFDEKLRLDKQRHAAPSGADVKLAKGGIRDIEFLVQCLQRLHGGRELWVRHGGTLLALSRLRDKELLSPLEYARLASAYQFMRHLEHRLQFDEDRQTHTLPDTKDQIDLLAHAPRFARKMPFSGLPSAGTLERQLDHHFSSVQDLYDRVIHSQLTVPVPDAAPVTTPLLASDLLPASDIEAPEVIRPPRGEFPSANLRRFLDQRAPAFAQLIAESDIARAVISLNDESFESFLEKAVANPAWLEMLDGNADVARCTIDLSRAQPVFRPDQLVSHPNLIEEVRAACGKRQGRTGFQAPRDPDGLRKFFRQQMIRIQERQASTIAFHVFKTLKRTSGAGPSRSWNAAYEIAISECSTPPSGLDYAPSNQMMVVIALEAVSECLSSILLPMPIWSS